jgi:tRNA (cmo5U34)-methyltransferase
MSDDPHFPANPDKFEFDERVAEIFPDMADRSIPIYRNMHSLHAKILIDDYIEHQRWPENGTYAVLDIGSSRSDFYDAIVAEAQSRGIDSLNLQYLPCDKSPAMVAATKDHRRMKVFEYDLADSQDTLYDGFSFNAVILHLVMQFIPLGDRGLAYDRLAAFTKRDGLLFYGEKETLDPGWLDKRQKRIAHAAHDFYIDFRIENGYSREEIEAKTKALKNAMWEVAYETDTKRNLEHVGFHPFIPTTRIGVFHSFVAIRGKG